MITFRDQRSRWSPFCLTLIMRSVKPWLMKGPKGRQPIIALHLATAKQWLNVKMIISYKLFCVNDFNLYGSPYRCVYGIFLEKNAPQCTYLIAEWLDKIINALGNLDLKDEPEKKLDQVSRFNFKLLTVPKACLCLRVMARAGTWGGPGGGASPPAGAQDQGWIGPNHKPPCSHVGTSQSPLDEKT